MNKIALFLLAASGLFGQTTNRYLASYSGTLTSSSSIVLTLQMPASGLQSVNFEGMATGLPPGVTVQCPGQPFTVAQFMNGTGATATAGTITRLPGAAIAAQATFWTSSNVTGSTTISPLLTFTAGTVAVLDWSALKLSYASGINSNITMTITNTGSGSCTLAVGIYEREQ